MLSKNYVITSSLSVKWAEHLSTGSITTITRGSWSEDTFFIQTETGNSKPDDVTASI